MPTEKQLGIERSFSVGGITVTPIARISKGEIHHRNSLYFYARKEPVAVIVLRGPSRCIYNVKGEEISVEDLLNDFPEKTELTKEIVNGSDT